MSKFVTIKTEDQKKILAYVQELFKSMKLDSNGNVIVPFSLFGDMRKYIVASHLDVKSFPTRRDLASQFLMQALVVLRKQGVTTVDWPDFERALNQCVQEYEAQPSVTHYVLLPLNLTGAWVSKRRCITVQGLKFKRSSWKEVQNLSGWKDFQKAINRDNPKALNLLLSGVFTPFLVDIQARTIDEGFEKAYTYFDLLRALINLVHLKDRTSIQFTGRPTPLGFCLPAAFYGVFNSQGNFETYYLNTEQYSYRRKEMTPDAGKLVNNLLNRFHKINEELRTLLKEALLKYVQAMDTAEWSNSFLSLWQILESVSRPTGQEVKLGKVVSRIDSLLGPDHQQTDMLKALEASRHKLVHSGRFSREGSHEVGYLKLIAEWTIIELFNKQMMFPDRVALLEFFEQTSVNTNRLRTRQNIIDKILRIRE